MDDFLGTGSWEGLAGYVGTSESKCAIKIESFGAGPSEKRDGKFMGRTIVWAEHGFIHKGVEKLTSGVFGECGVMPMTDDSKNRRAITPNWKEI